MTSFNKEYAQIYDVLYSEKDYKNEIDLIEKIIKEYKPGAKNILDYGCGTSNHAKILASRGYKVFCLDKNENMLEIAREKLRALKNVQFFNIDSRDKIKPNSIDICLLLFDVLSYMNTNEEINDFLSYLKKILVEDGLFIFDFWHGPGVINLKPEQRQKEYKAENKNILRLTKPEHDIDNRLVNVTHQVIISEGDKVINRFNDEHKMRYFFKNEIDLFLNRHNLKIMKFGTWNDINIVPTNNDWSALIVSKKI